MKKNIKYLLKSSLENIINQSIVNVWRVFSESELEEIPDKKRDEESDGNTYLEFTNGIILGVYPNSELFTLDYEYLKLPEVPKEAKAVSSNSYWVKRTGKKILKVEGIYGRISTPYGIALELEGGFKVMFQYLSESEYTFDALVIK